MSIPIQMDRVGENLALSFLAVAAKGGDIPQDPSSLTLPSAINSIPTSGAPLGALGDLSPGDIFHIPYGTGLMPHRIVRDNGMPIGGQYPGWQTDCILFMQERIITGEAWGANHNDYSTSFHDAFLNTTYLGRYPEWVQNALLEGGIPVTVNNTPQVVNIVRKVFSPSLVELGLSAATPLGQPFNPNMFTNNESRIGLLLDTLQANAYSSRNLHLTQGTNTISFSATGTTVNVAVSALNSSRIRPFMCLPPTMKVATIGGHKILVP